MVAEQRSAIHKGFGIVGFVNRRDDGNASSHGTYEYKNRSMENGMTNGGNIVDGIMQRVDGMLGEVRTKVEQVSEEDTKFKRNIQEVFDAGKQDMATMITEQVKMEKKSREVLGTTIMELQKWTQGMERKANDLDAKMKGQEAWSGGSEGKIAANNKDMSNKIEELATKGGQSIGRGNGKWSDPDKPMTEYKSIQGMPKLGAF